MWAWLEAAQDRGSYLSELQEADLERTAGAKESGEMNETLICCAVLVWGILSILILRRFLNEPACKHQWAKMVKKMSYWPDKDKKNNYIDGVVVLQKCTKCDLEQAWFEGSMMRYDLQVEYAKDRLKQNAKEVAKS